MLHQISTERYGNRGTAMGHAIETCIHCGFCLPTCPTYEILGDESDSPRGRIFLMKEVLEGKLAPDEVAPHIDRCLGCVACQTHCPSGVEYGNLLSSYRSLPEIQLGSMRGKAARVRRWLASLTLPYPSRFRLAMKLGMLGRKAAFLTPRALRPMVDLVPQTLPAAESLPTYSPAAGEPRATVYLHAGCAAQVLRPQITSAAIRVLNLNGVTVQIPQSQSCCGALHWHIGDATRAARMARQNLQAFGDDNTPILTTAAGCGSGMHEYPLILADEVSETRSHAFASRVTDISVYLDRLGIKPPPPQIQPIRIAYHDACHLAHAQKVRKPPRNLLSMIPGVELVDLTESDLCCGSAGTYNIDQPEMAKSLGRRKAQHIIDSGCDVVALGNIGCQIQIEQHLRQLGRPIPVMHVIQLLDMAYQSTDIKTAMFVD